MALVKPSIYTLDFTRPGLLSVVLSLAVYTVQFMPSRGPITTSGNAHLRRVPVEASWSYPHRPNGTGFLLRRQKNLALSEEVKTIAWKAQHRLNKRYKTLAAKGENKNQIVTAIARELLGFIWAIAAKTENLTLAAGQGGMDQAPATQTSSVGPDPRPSSPDFSQITGKKPSSVA